LLIALAIFLIGFFVGRNAAVIWVVPVAVGCTVLVFLIWTIQGELSWFKVAIWVGYMAALNTGYLTGAALKQARTGSSPEPDWAPRHVNKR